MKDGKAPINWPFPTYKGKPLPPPKQETKKQWLNKQKDALL